MARKQRSDKQIIRYEKVELLKTIGPESPLEAIENVMVFDARCLDKETWHQLLRVLPDLTRIRKAWKAHFVQHGCVSCRKKKVEYGAGGFCYTCLARITTRMRTCFRKLDAGRDIPDEIASLSRRYSAAQRLFNSEDE